MLKEAAVIQGAIDKGERKGAMKILNYNSKISFLDDILYKWFIQVQIYAPSVNFTGDVLKHKVLELRDDVIKRYGTNLQQETYEGLNTFKTSN
ncbi:hypothetical protein HMI56_004836 [Coelomomyces lativittatus]|nr:hypothetical protein HMI56_004836 [Coelomomyces lativittatus]